MTADYKTLTFAGALPFVIGALLLAFGADALPLLGPLDTMLSAYSLLILSFLAGINWGQHLATQAPIGRLLPLISNVMALIAWLMFLTLGFQAQMYGFACAFFVQLLIDWRVFAARLTTQDYMLTRLFVSLVVMASLLCAGTFA